MTNHFVLNYLKLKLFSAVITQDVTFCYCSTGQFAEMSGKMHEDTSIESENDSSKQFSGTMTHWQISNLVKYLHNGLGLNAPQISSL